VSIKKKFATTVATASLLAGLFGSAFVPAARASTAWDADATVTPTVFYDLNASGAFAKGTTSLKSSDGDGTSTTPYFLRSGAVNDGGEDNAAMTTPGKLSVLGDTDNCNNDAAADDAFCDVDGDLLSGTVTAQATSTNGLVVYVTDTTTCSADEDDYSTTDSANILADADITNEPFLVCVGVASHTTTGKGAITISVNGVALDPIYVQAVGDATSITLSATYTHLAMDPAADATLAFTYKWAVSGISNLRDIYGADGSAAFTFANIVADLDLADEHDIKGVVDGTRVSDLITANDDGLDIVAGSITVVTDADAFCDSGNQDAGDTKTLKLWTDSDDDDVIDSAELQSNTITVTCTADGDEAEIVGVALSATSVRQGGELDVEISVEDGFGNPMGYLGDGEVLDFDAAAAYAESVYPYLIDGGAAVAASEGSTDIADAVLATSVPVEGLLWKDWDDAVDATATLFTLDAPTLFSGKQYLELQFGALALDGTGAVDDDTAGEYVVSYTVTTLSGGTSSGTAAIVAGAKLKKATITISAAAGKLVTVTIEKVSNGRTFTYYRKANASGVATFKIRRTGTWEVFAAYGDDVTDTVTLKR
jgi:hypothetical protein